MYQRRLPEDPRVRLLPEEAIDVNCLLRVADALVSDYSSAAFDYALLDRPIHFFVPDLDAYRGGRGLYEPLETLTGGTQYTEWPPLLAAIAEASGDPESAGRAVARRIRERSRYNDAPGSCARITATVARAIGQPLREIQAS
jgi:CDP-glycerol glycerophosphotransferase